MILLFSGCTKSSSSNNDSKDFAKKYTYYSNHNVKSEIDYINNIKNGKAVFYYISGDTQMHGRYKNDSIVFMFTYDSLGNKIVDERMVFHEIENMEYRVGDSVSVRFWVEGADTNDLFLYASALKIHPDTSIRFSQHLKQDSKKYINEYQIIPETSGKYELLLNCINTNTMKVIGHKKVYVTIKQ